MSAEQHDTAPNLVPGIPEEAVAGTQILEVERRRASEERRHAASIGDYASAEWWYGQECQLDRRIALRERRQSPPARP